MCVLYGSGYIISIARGDNSKHLDTLCIESVICNPDSFQTV